MSSRARKILQLCEEKRIETENNVTLNDSLSGQQNNTEVDSNHIFLNEIPSISDYIILDCEVTSNGDVIQKTNNELLEIGHTDKIFSNLLTNIDYIEECSQDDPKVIMSEDEIGVCNINPVLENEANEEYQVGESEKNEVQGEDEDEYCPTSEDESEDENENDEDETEDEDHADTELVNKNEIRTAGPKQIMEDDNEAEHSGTIGKSREQAKLKRVTGDKYLGYKRSEGKILYNIPRESRKLMRRGCSHTAQTPKKNGRTFLCGSITENKRQDIFNHFWKELNTWKEKRAFMIGLVAARGIRRRRKTDLLRKPKKLEGYDIYLPKDNGDKIRVCRSFLLSTLDLGEDTFKRWVRNSQIKHNELNDDQEHADVESVDNEEVSTDHIKTGNKKRKLFQNDRTKKIENIRKWLDLIPKVPSHYCRASSKKTYVESSFRSILHMYNVFLEWCKDNNIQPIGRKIFSDVLKEENIAIHQPRKDQCDTCSAFKAGNIDEVVYQAHVEKKDRGRAAKNAYKESASADKLIVTMDLQSVLVCPKTLASSMYYKQKLQVHNFTVYELNHSDVHLYVWNEVEGGVTANEFTTCIVHFIQNSAPNYKKIVLISDGCNYQNRNRVLTSALCEVSKEKEIVIEQLYLEKGHTMMEADSVHSVLEHLFKPPINSPSDYVARMRLARPKHPYNVILVHHEFFLDFDGMPNNFASIRPGKRVGEHTVTDIRQFQYLPNGEIKYKLDYNTEWHTLPQRRPAAEKVNPKQLYINRIPITESKYRQLQELKPVIETEHHDFYDNLPYISEKKSTRKISKASNDTK